MGNMNVGPSCKDCHGYSPEECMGCSGYPSGTTFGFQGESEPPLISVPLSSRTEHVMSWVKDRMAKRRTQ